MRYLNVEPAYGVQLNSQKAVKEHFEAGKDFRILTFGPEYGRYVNKRDLESFSDGVKLEVRYGRNGEKVVIL